jgi:uncharacterized membrane protein YfcA
VSEFEIIAVIVVMTVGALVQASVGFGLSLAAAPVLILINPLLVPAPLLVAALGLTILVSYRDRQGIEVRGVGSLMAGRIVGTVPGVFLIASLQPERMRLVLGILILIAVGMSLVGIRLSQKATTLFGVGIVSGFMSSTAAVGGPPIALAYQHAEGQRLRGTLSFVLTFGTMISLIGLFLGGRFRLLELQMALVLMPGTLIGFLLSRKTAAWLDRGYTRTAVLVLASATALLVVVASLL